MSDTHFVLERLNWRRVGPAHHRLPGATRIAAFDTADEAEAFRADEEERARATVNPFAGGATVPAEQTGWPAEVVLDWLADHGIDPPPVVNGSHDWAGWWDREHPTWTVDQRRVAWVPLDKVRFFRMREAPRRPVAYAVVRVEWAWDDSWYQASPEGGTVQTLYRRRERAEAEAARLTADARRAMPPDGDVTLDLDQRPDPGLDPFDPPRTVALAEYGGRLTTPSEAEFFEVVAVELEGDG